jgi:hypothetical protein
MNIYEFIRKLSDIVSAPEFSGFSLNAYGETPATGYMVSLPDFERKIPVESPMLAHILLYCADYAAKLGEVGVYLGAWVNDGTVYLDVSLNVADREKALALGAEYNQLSVWDVLNASSIDIVK